MVHESHPIEPRPARARPGGDRPCRIHRPRGRDGHRAIRLHADPPHDAAGAARYPVGAGGWLASANYLGYLLGALSAATLRVRAATAVRAGLVVIGLATLGMGLTRSFPAWLAAARARRGRGARGSWSSPPRGRSGRSARPAGPCCAASSSPGSAWGSPSRASSVSPSCNGSAGSPMAWQGLGDHRARRHDGDLANPPNRARRGRDTEPATRRPQLPVGPRLGAPCPLLRDLRLRLHHPRDLCAGHGPGARDGSARVRLVLAGVRRRGGTLDARGGGGTSFIGNRRLWALSHLVMALGVSAPRGVAHHRRHHDGGPPRRRHLHGQHDERPAGGAARRPARKRRASWPR